MDYRAVAVKDQEHPYSARPMRAHLDGNEWVVRDPVIGYTYRYPIDDIFELGGWNDKSKWILTSSGEPCTWAAYAAHQAGEVLRQNELVEKLILKGITRFEKEPYVVQDGLYKYQLILNYDELDALLSADEDALRKGR